MRSEALGGFILAWAVISLAVVAHCFATYFGSRRERETAVFGLFALSLVVYDCGAAVFLSADRLRDGVLGLDLFLLGQLAASACLVDLAREHARLPRNRVLLGVVYGLAAVLAVLVLADRVLVLDPRGAEPYVPVRGVGAVPFALATVASAVYAAALLVRAFLRDKNEGFSALLGVVLLVVAVSHDALFGLGLGRPVWVGPLGFAAFVLGVQAAQLWRFGALQTELERKARELRRRSKELARANETLRETQNELVRKEQLAAVGELSAVVAHEIRNPLTIISNSVSSLRRGGVSEVDRKELLGIVDEECTRMDHLVTDLLVYARPVRTNLRLVSPRELVTAAMRVAEGRLDVGFELLEPAPVPDIWADPGLIRQVLDNLVRNAVEAMPTGGVLTVTLAPAAGAKRPGVEILIQDTGEGMDTTVRSRAFDPFFTTRKSGTGLGLAIVARLIDAHGGHLSMKSAAGAGTQMKIFLPVGSDPGQEAEPARDSGPPRSTPVPAMPQELLDALSPEGASSGGEP